MSSNHRVEPIRVGVLTDEPLRLEGAAGIFEELPGEDFAPILPVFGDLEELLSDGTVPYLVVDLHSGSGGIKTLDAIRRRRPDLRLIVIGPERNDRLVLDSIMAGARAFLDLHASPRTVRQAVDVVIAGSIWAPRRLLSQLIDHLLGVTDSGLANNPPRLTERECQILDLILTARSNREIARELGIEERTVQAHVGRLMRKTGAENRVDLLMRLSKSKLHPTTSLAEGKADRHHIERHAADRRRSGSSRSQVVTDR